jgi:Domain of unknown function (DUF4338)
MIRSELIPALTLEATLKRRLRRHLEELGFRKQNDGTLAPPGQGKDAIRALHQHQRRQRLSLNRTHITATLPKLSSRFADGSDVNARRIRLSLEKVKAGTREADLFRLASLTWSVPVSNGFGRRLRYLVWDEYNGKLAGLIALGDPVFNLSVRDRHIGWSSQDRILRLVNVLDAYVLGALPPYSMLLGGKAVACLVRTQELFNDFSTKYGNVAGLISGVNKQASLLLVTTSSSLGRSSVYNRLRLDGTDYLRPIGFTDGWGHFHIPDDLFAAFRAYLRKIGHPYADRNRFGQGPNWRLRTIRVTLKLLGFSEGLLRHGIGRQVFACELADNSKEILRGDTRAPVLSSLRTVNEVSEAAVDRWMLPRSSRSPEFTKWKRDELFRLLCTTDGSGPQVAAPLRTFDNIEEL